MDCSVKDTDIPYATWVCPVLLKRLWLLHYLVVQWVAKVITCRKPSLCLFEPYFEPPVHGSMRSTKQPFPICLLCTTAGILHFKHICLIFKMKKLLQCFTVYYKEGFSFSIEPYHQWVFCSRQPSSEVYMRILFGWAYCNWGRHEVCCYTFSSGHSCSCNKGGFMPCVSSAELHCLTSFYMSIADLG